METADCPNAPRLDPRVRRTRKLLEDALRDLLTERFYDDISVGDIAERATVNRATFYAHYEDKRDLTSTMVRGDLEAALKAGLSPGASLDAETLTAFAVALFEFIGKTMSSCPKHADQFSPHIGPTLQETIQSFLRTWLDLDPGAMRSFPGATRDAVATVLAWSLYGSAFRWSRLPNRAPAAAAAREVVALLMRPNFPKSS